MSIAPTQQYFIKLWLKNFQEPLMFQIAEAAWGRFKRAFQEKKSGFFIFATRDGRSFILDLGSVQLAQSGECTGEEETDCDDDRPDTSLYFADGTIATFVADDPADLARIFTTLKGSNEGQTLSFRASDGRLVMFATDELVLLEVCTSFVEEGYKHIYVQERGTLPPR
jgi:hypothetical protein